MTNDLQFIKELFVRPDDDSHTTISLALIRHNSAAQYFAIPVNQTKASFLNTISVGRLVTDFVSENLSILNSLNCPREEGGYNPYTGEHFAFSINDWQQAVRSGATQSGYTHWVHQELNELKTSSNRARMKIEELLSRHYVSFLDNTILTSHLLVEGLPLKGDHCLSIMPPRPVKVMPNKQRLYSWDETGTFCQSVYEVTPAVHTNQELIGQLTGRYAGHCKLYIYGVGYRFDGHLGLIQTMGSIAASSDPLILPVTEEEG